MLKTHPIVSFVKDLVKRASQPAKMSQNWPQRHRYSFPQNQQNFEYSTPDSGNNGRASSLGQIEYQDYPSQSLYYPQSEPRGTPNEFQHEQSKAWQDGFSPSRHPAHPQRPPANNFDPGDLQPYIQSVHKESWTGAAVGATFDTRFDARQPLGLQPWHNFTYQGQKAHTITDCGFSPVQQRQPLTPTRTSVPSFLDSGFVSSNTSSQDVSKYPNSNYEYTAGDPSLFNTPLQATATSVKSEPGEETKRGRKAKAPVSPCSNCGKQLKNPSDARYVPIPKPGGSY